MKPFTVGLMIAATVGLGLILGQNYLKGVRRPVMNGVHLLFGVGAVEGVALMLHGQATVAGSIGRVVFALLGLSLLSGLIRPVIRAQFPRPAALILATHAGIGLLGLLLFLIWATQTPNG